MALGLGVLEVLVHLRGCARISPGAHAPQGCASPPPAPPGLPVRGGRQELQPRGRRPARLPQRGHHPPAAPGAPRARWADPKSPHLQPCALLWGSLGEPPPLDVPKVTPGAKNGLVWGQEGARSPNAPVLVPVPPLDHYYGCVVRKKVMYLEELKTGTQDFGGWLWGAGVSPSVSPACVLLPWAVPPPGAKSPFHCPSAG